MMKDISLEFKFMKKYKGHKISNETKEKIRQANLGRKQSKEEREMRSKSAKKAGTGKWMKGRNGEKHSEIIKYDNI